MKSERARALRGRERRGASCAEVGRAGCAEVGLRDWDCDRDGDVEWGRVRVVGWGLEGRAEEESKERAMDGPVAFFVVRDAVVGAFGWSKGRLFITVLGVRT